MDAYKVIIHTEADDDGNARTDYRCNADHPSGALLQAAEYAAERCLLVKLVEVEAEY